MTQQQVQVENNIAIAKGLAILALVLVLAGVLTRWGFSASSTDVVVGQAYQVRVHQEQAVEGIGSSVFTVQFAGEHRGMRDQYVPREYVRRVTEAEDPDIKPGWGKWVSVPVQHPYLEGIKYGTDGYRMEFWFNGELQIQRNYPTGGTPRR